MIFDSNGLPRDNGASDSMDSARLAATMALFEYPQQLSRSKLSYYSAGGTCYRYPFVDPAWPLASNNPKNVTRDQIVPLAAAYYKLQWYAKGYDILAVARSSGTLIKRAQNTEADVPGSTKKFPNGADVYSPSHMNHFRICARQPRSLLGSLWLIMDLTFHALFTPMREPNQILAMAMTAGPAYVKYFRFINRRLNDSIRDYWSGWRGESELAEHMITYLATKY